MTRSNTDQETLPPLPRLIAEPLVRRALEEDLGRAGDITSDSTIPARTQARLRAVARENGRVAGVDMAALAFHLVDPDLSVHCQTRDGMEVMPGQTILHVEGSARAILTAERVALNFLGHMSGIASLTTHFVREIEGTKARVVCTRKTTPGLRAAEKFAVRAGGGTNHRFGLDDGILIKDNHIAIAGGIGAAVTAARAHAGHMVKIEVETDTLAQVKEALAAGVDAILLDNMDLDMLSEAVSVISGQAIAEASGGVTLDTAGAIAQTGVDLISSGALTHSAQTLDIGLDFDHTL